MKIKLTKQAIKSLMAIPNPYKLKIIDMIDRLPNVDSKKLTNLNFYSVPVSKNYRIIFEIKNNILTVIKIGHRQSVYKNI